MLALFASPASSQSLYLKTSSVKEEVVAEEAGKVWTPERRLCRITFCTLVRLSKSVRGGGGVFNTVRHKTR
jgi:hypothetical protein